MRNAEKAMYYNTFTFFSIREDFCLYFDVTEEIDVGDLQRPFDCKLLGLILFVFCLFNAKQKQFDCVM